MNERIKELMVQSIDYACANQKSMDTAMEKFAELIIQECADICFDRDYATGDRYGEEIVKYFGVEQ